MEHPPRFQRGFEDAYKRSTTADVSVEAFLDLLGSRVGIFLEDGSRRHHETRRAEAAHQAVGIAEGLLNGVKPGAVGQAVDCTDLFSLDLDRQCRTRVH